MNFEFNQNINNFLKIILKNAQSQNLRVFFVGGIVRDKILNMPTFDIDLLILGNAIDFALNLPCEIKIKSTHEDFCTVKLEYNNIEIDIASSRSENYPHSGCLPVLNKIGVDITEDVSRRDFSINSLYCELKLEDDKIFYTLIDYVDGQNDINNKILKVLHNKSYIDDPTRIIRGLGFKYRFGFDFSKADKNLIDNYLNNIDYSNMSIDRNIKVIKKVLNSKFQKEIFKEITEKKYYKIINKQDLKINFEIIEELFDKLCLDMVSMSEFYLKILLNKEIEIMENENIIQKYKLFKKSNLVNLAYYFYKTKNKSLEKYLQIKDIDLNITGDKLINLGYEQGKIIGEILDNLLLEKLENSNNLQNEKQEIDWILKNYPKN